MERLCSKFLRKWLGDPPSFSAINLYSKTSKLPLPVSSVVEEFKVAKARAVSTLLSSEDRKVRHVEAPASQCGAVSCTLNHILTGCPKALAEGRYRWRYDKILMEIAKWVEQLRVKVNNKQAHPLEAITFVREGDKAYTIGTVAKNPTSSLQRASDWELGVDLKRKLVFLSDMAVTYLRPDMVLLSRSMKTIIITELTVPWEERLATSHQLKKAKYQYLVDTCCKGVACNQLPY